MDVIIIFIAIFFMVALASIDRKLYKIVNNQQELISLLGKEDVKKDKKEEK